MIHSAYTFDISNIESPITHNLFISTPSIPMLSQKNLSSTSFHKRLKTFFYFSEESKDSTQITYHNVLSNINISKFTQALENISATVSQFQCAKSIRIALQTAGAKILQHPIAASDWGQTLESLGYKKIQPAFDQPLEGDIYIIKRTKRHSYGHIAGYTGTEWVSDYKQPTYEVYHDSGVKYQYYRLDSSS